MPDPACSGEDEQRGGSIRWVCGSGVSRATLVLRADRR